MDQCGAKGILWWSWDTLLRFLRENLLERLERKNRIEEIMKRRINNRRKFF